MYTCSNKAKIDLNSNNDQNLKAQQQKTILFLLPFESCSGLELFGIRFAKSLLKNNINAVIAAPPNSLIQQQCLIRNVPYIDYCVHFKFSLSAISSLNKIINKTKPCCVVAFRTHSIYALHLYKILYKHHIPTVLFYRLGAGKQSRKDPIHRVLFKNISCVIANSEYLKNRIIDKWGIEKSKVYCIKSGIDINLYKPDSILKHKLRHELNIPNNSIVIGNTGRIHKEKGAEELIHIVFGPNGIIKKFPNTYLVYVGHEYKPNYCNYLKNIVNEYGHSDKFIILPFRVDIEKVYPLFDIFALAVISVETYAYVVLEAMASEVIPVIPYIGGLKEMLIDNINGFYYEHRNFSDMQKKIENICLMSENERLVIASNARKHIVSYASWDNMFLQYLDVFRFHKIL